MASGSIWTFMIQVFLFRILQRGTRVGVFRALIALGAAAREPADRVFVSVSGLQGLGFRGRWGH